jgi:hypothetical protein
MAEDQFRERCPDCTGNFLATLNPTFNSINCKPLLAAENINAELFKVYPIPV